jgi:DNA uptake protein ComE-like DNA-binding protein
MSRDTPPSVRRAALARALAALATVLACGVSPAADKSPAPAPGTRGAAPAQKPAKVALVDINSASRAQLKTLPGIGDAEATRIIDGRPYLSKADLASEHVIRAGVYLSLKNRIIAIQTQRPKGKQ